MWSSFVTVILQSISVCLSALLLNETFGRQQAGGLSVRGCQFTSASVYQPCPRSVTLIGGEPFRLDQAAIRPQEMSLHGQRYGHEVGMISFCLCLFFADTHQLLNNNFSATLLPDVKSSQVLPISSTSPNPVSLDKSTFASLHFAKNIIRGHAQNLRYAVPLPIEYFT